MAAFGLPPRVTTWHLLLGSNSDSDSGSSSRRGRSRELWPLLWADAAGLLRRSRGHSSSRHGRRLRTQGGERLLQTHTRPQHLLRLLLSKPPWVDVQGRLARRRARVGSCWGDG